MVHLRWRPELVAALVAPRRPSASDLAAVAASIEVDDTQVRSTLERMLAFLP
jgi:hypothetical protein